MGTIMCVFDLKGQYGVYIQQILHEIHLLQFKLNIFQKCNYVKFESI